MSTRAVVRAVALASCCLLVSDGAMAGARGPGEYCGVPVFDRWDGCYLYSGIYLMYISENVKEALREYAGQPIRLNATEVDQPHNPGDGRIDAYAVLGPATATESWVPLEGLEVRAAPSFDGGKCEFRMAVVNTGHESVKVLSREFAPTLLTTRPARYYGPSDGPSFALLTRYELACPSPSDRVSGGTPCRLTVVGDKPVPAEAVLRPNQELAAVVRLEVPPGQYEFLCGYGGGVHEGKCLASDLIAFDVDEPGVPHVVER